jgi:hypothetical protein
MAEAMQPATLPPEAIALIKQGTPKPQTETPLVSSVKPREVSTPAPVATATETPAKPRAKKEQPATASPLVSIYVRLPSDLSQSLLKASLERKMNKTRPFTQQDIIAEALQTWLQKNGSQPEKN